MHLPTGICTIASLRSSRTAVFPTRVASCKCSLIALGHDSIRNQVADVVVVVAETHTETHSQARVALCDEPPRQPAWHAQVGAPQFEHATLRIQAQTSRVDPETKMYKTHVEARGIF